jgi:hypothetical protein
MKLLYSEKDVTIHYRRSANRKGWVFLVDFNLGDGTTVSEYYNSTELPMCASKSEVITHLIMCSLERFTENN